MKVMKLIRAMSVVASVLASFSLFAADYPKPEEGIWTVRDFRFHTGEALPELQLHYATVGARTGEPVLPDAIGTGKSSKPSDGLRTSFPKYNYDDMVTGQYRLVREHLGVRHLRLVIGNSMGGMQTWMWAQKYPDDMDVGGAHGVAAQRDVGPQLDDAAPAHRVHSQRPRVDERPVHQAAARLSARVAVLRHRHQRRQPGPVQERAHA